MMYWQMTLIWWMFWHSYLHDIWQVGFRQICTKPILSYILFQIKTFCKTHNDVLNSIMVTSPMYYPTVATQILTYSEKMMRFFRTFPA
jgi:hypothetical protein